MSQLPSSNSFVTHPIIQVTPQPAFSSPLKGQPPEWLHSKSSPFSHHILSALLALSELSFNPHFHQPHSFNNIITTHSHSWDYPSAAYNTRHYPHISTPTSTAARTAVNILASRSINTIPATRSSPHHSSPPKLNGTSPFSIREPRPSRPHRQPESPPQPTATALLRPNLGALPSQPP